MSVDDFTGAMKCAGNYCLPDWTLSPDYTEYALADILNGITELHPQYKFNPNPAFLPEDTFIYGKPPLKPEKHPILALFQGKARSEFLACGELDAMHPKTQTGRVTGKEIEAYIKRQILNRLNNDPNFMPGRDERAEAIRLKALYGSLARTCSNIHTAGGLIYLDLEKQKKADASEPPPPGPVVCPACPPPTPPPWWVENIGWILGGGALLLCVGVIGFLWWTSRVPPSIVEEVAAGARTWMDEALDVRSAAQAAKLEELHQIRSQILPQGPEQLETVARRALRNAQSPDPKLLPETMRRETTALMLERMRLIDQETQSTLARMYSTTTGKAGATSFSLEEIPAGVQLRYRRAVTTVATRASYLEMRKSLRVVALGEMKGEYHVQYRSARDLHRAQLLMAMRFGDPWEFLALPLMGGSWHTTGPQRIIIKELTGLDFPTGTTDVRNLEAIMVALWECYVDGKTGDYSREEVMFLLTHLFVRPPYPPFAA